MAIPSTQSSFLRYDLTSEELIAGTQFSSAHKLVIQNLIADAAEEKISLTFDATNPQAFIQREAELAGQIGILKYLLSLEEVSKQQSNSEI